MGEDRQLLFVGRAVAFEHALDVLGQDIEFDIDEVAHERVSKISRAMGVWNNPDGEAFRIQFSYGQADAVDRDRTFASEVMSKFAGQSDLETVITAALIESKNGAGAIDMSLHEVAAQEVTSGERLLEVHERIAAEMFEIGALEGFLEQIESELFGAVTGDGKATSIYSDAIAGAGTLGNSRGIDLELCPALGRANPEDGGDFLN